MFKIGDFSKLSQVSVKALRYYDEIGLLRPVHIDPFTSYRYYSLEQLPRLNRILVLKDLGFSLEQIRFLLGEEVPIEQLRGMLRMRRAELQQQVAASHARLARVEARLAQIETEDRMSHADVVIKSVAAQAVISLREVVPTYGRVNQTFGKVFQELSQKGIQPIGPCIAIYYEPEYREHDVDVEAAYPVNQVQAVQNGLILKELPGEKTMACLIYQGSYDTLSQGYSALMSWIEISGYQICGANREVYLRGPQPGVEPAKYVTEIQFPIVVA